MNAQTVALLVVMVQGSVQFWHRHCDGAGKCELPQPLSERLPVSGKIDAPSGPGKLGQFSAQESGGGLTLALSTYWVMPPDGSAAYLVAQGKFGRDGTAGGQRLGECSQYASMSPTFFPVGACSAYVPDANGGSDEYGVTFYK